MDETRYIVKEMEANAPFRKFVQVMFVITGKMIL